MKEKLIDQAKVFMNTSLPYGFSDLEVRIIKRFFTNTVGRIFFVHSLPENMISALLAMYSRMKNSRGLRGMFVDSFLPQALASLTNECRDNFEGNPEKFVKSCNIKGLEDFINHSQECFDTYKEFSKLGSDPEYLEILTASKKMEVFLKKWLDQYGHNSIARTAGLHICFEQISILAAKSIEWNRPGFAAIELSTRYVDMAGASVYPIEDELALLGVDSDPIKRSNDVLYGHYRGFQGENFDGRLPTFLRDTHAPNIPGVSEAQITMGVIGETCDILGNFLPASTLTSVGVSISGESFPTMIKHLLLDDAPENHAIVDLLMSEARKVGADQFLRHLDLTDFDVMNWSYLSPELRHEHEMPDCLTVNKMILASLGNLEAFSACCDIESIVDKIVTIERSSYDKLSRGFESVTASFAGQMSFRGWRDLQRMGFCAHKRSRLNPSLGIYQYDKPRLVDLNPALHEVWAMNRQTYIDLLARDAPLPMTEYHMALGNKVNYWMTGNLRQLEFCNWQRTKPSVNHEVRQIFLSFEKSLRSQYPWWSQISRADITPAYIFARGSAQPLA